MVAAGSAEALQARLRLRELAQYYSTASSLPPADFGPRNGADGITRDFDLADFQPYLPDLSKDPSLTGIAQLTALRTNCQRSFISLIADSAQHVIAEATRTISPYDKDLFDEGDGIILGAQSIPLTFGICTTTIGVFTGTCKHSFGADTVVSDKYICIPDLLSEDMTARLPAIQALPPILRCYIEVPLRSEGGYVIGSICVMDPIARKATERDIVVMEDMSKLVMRHLELIRMKEDHRRAVRLLEGMGHFIKGKDSILDPSEPTDTRPDIPRTITPSSQTLSTEVQDSNHRTLSVGEPTGAINGTIASDHPLSDIPEMQSIPTSPGVTFKLPFATPMTRTISSSSDKTTRSSYENPNQQNHTGEVQLTTPTFLGVRSIFSRAANLIRESMDLDASCFLEIPQYERYRRFQPRKNSYTAQEHASNGESASQTSSESSSESSPEESSADTNGLSHSSGDAPSETLCHRLGFSTLTESSLAGSKVPDTFLTAPAALLSSLSLRYPQGHIFHFDSVGSITPTDEKRETAYATKSGRRRQKKLSTRLLQFFPTARSLMFFPMYDNDTQHVYAAYFGYIRSTARVLQKSELTYVSGFANSITCEVMRIRTEATDKAKSDFISSISHELRSPLHGILAANQLLLESEILPKQTEFLTMIDTCARTLLDIMNQLLDHAKINHFAKGQESTPSRTKMKRADSENTSLITRMDLLAVVEETVASMAVSSSHKYWHSKEVRTPLASPGTPEPSEDEQATVPIILDITPRDNWTFNSEAGSWRRIIMNLVGNSLKYTRKGHIKVGLSIRESSKSQNQKIAELRVSDTGQGISAEYLKHRLYTPFAQENNLSVGAGLGLSLVQSIVTSLNGNIRVDSKVGIGTEVLVAIPLEHCESRADGDTQSTASQVMPTMEGQTFKILGFECVQAQTDAPILKSDCGTDSLEAIRVSLTSIMKNWFRATLSESEANLLVIEESFLERALETYDTAHNTLLVIGLHGRRISTEKIKHANFVYLLPPIGPTRVSQALRTLLLERDQQRSNPQTSIRPIQDTVSVAKINGTLDQSTSKFLSPWKEEIPPPEKLGSSAAVVIPASSASPASVKPPIHTSPNIIHSNGTAVPRKAILIVDDNAINLRILTTAVSRLKLQPHGVETITAVNGLEALNAYIAATNAGTRVSVIFMDISMPVMDGITATREIRAFEKAKGMKRTTRSTVVAVTGLASAEAQIEIENSGFDVYLRKPVGLKAVRDVVMADMEENTSPKDLDAAWIKPGSRAGSDTMITADPTGVV